MAYRIPAVEKNDEKRYIFLLQFRKGVVQMNDLSLLEPRDVWEIFAGICATPHPSGGEKKLSLYLKKYAEKNGLQARLDSYGNLRIDRKTGDLDSAIILQAHMDMVPACVDEKKFDFEREAITPLVKGARVVADGTTLGGDDGMGVALALAMLTDKTLQKVPLAALFTRQEEVGMLGAAQLENDFLRGKLLVNLDSGCDNIFQIGCAGGVRTRLDFAPDMQKAPAGQAFCIEIGNLAGGHSGVDIGLQRTNAIILLAKLLDGLPLELASIAGGNADNAIPSQSSCCGVSKTTLPKLEKQLKERADSIRPTLTGCDCDFTVKLSPVRKLEQVFSPSFTMAFLTKLANVPDGPVRYSARYRSVHTSSNIGMIVPAEKGFSLISSQRSFADAERDKFARKIVRHFGKLARRAEHAQPYPGWKPERNIWQRLAGKLWREVNASEAHFEVIHAGLECGIIRGKRPDLPIIATFPLHGNLHTPAEFLDIASVGRVSRFLRAFLLRAGVEK